MKCCCALKVVLLLSSTPTRLKNTRLRARRRRRVCAHRRRRSCAHRRRRSCAHRRRRYCAHRRRRSDTTNLRDNVDLLRKTNSANMTENKLLKPSTKANNYKKRKWRRCLLVTDTASRDHYRAVIKSMTGIRQNWTEYQCAT
ncbi:uncharacterized protein LOC130355679 isoform X11 [Hyla sarda]|uniref:uncharacterized protein LOC130355679 isoform X11 n=1 Tax=Hyla sarda TaxID=327740 RepID=UPI0024C3F86D|nr:uncharacterized protein LOC130355679 isoform X11 [Hyla sarda]